MCFTRIYGFIFCDSKVINSSITSINTSLSNIGTGEIITSADDAPIGFSCMSSAGTNNPFPIFWCSFLTMTGNSTGYKQQLGFTWANSQSPSVAYRVYDNNSWRSWYYLSGHYKTFDLNLISSLSLNGSAYCQIIGSLVFVHLSFWVNTAVAAGTKISQLPASYTYDFHNNYAIPIRTTNNSVNTFDIISTGAIKINGAAAINEHYDLSIIGRVIQPFQQ